MKISSDNFNQIKRFVNNIMDEIREEAIPMLINEFNSEFKRK